MSVDTAPAGGGNPFTARAALLLVLFGALVFIALLWSIGAGMAGGSTNDGGSHAGGKGLTGFAAFSEFLEERGYQVRKSRNEGALDDPGLLVLTPPFNADAKKIDAILEKRSTAGPTLLILPKWLATEIPAPMRPPGAKDGWVLIFGEGPPVWGEDVEALGALDIKSGEAVSSGATWTGFGITGSLPGGKAAQTMATGHVLSLVQDAKGQTLAGFVDDGGSYPALEEAAGVEPVVRDDDDDDYDHDYTYPVVVVSDPDLLNNYGFARKESAMLAQALVRAAMDGEDMAVKFDMTLNGHGRSANLLTLAFTPPFLAATLCLLMAMLAVGWRAFIRFGPPRKAGLAIAFGKQALVANSSGLLRRARRLHLLADPYVDRVRERIARALALPKQIGKDATDTAIDRAMAARSPDSPPFTELAGRLRAARGSKHIVKAAHDLHALERTLTR